MFNKKNYDNELTIEVKHDLLDCLFTFFLTKKLSIEIKEAQRNFLGIPEEKREAEAKRKLIETLSLMVTKEPLGFEDFPKDERSLQERFISYFDDSEIIEFETILLSVWSVYMAAAIPVAYLKSVQDNSTGNSKPARELERITT